MELYTTYAGVIWEIDAAKMLAKVIVYGPEDVTTDWLMISNRSGVYHMPAKGDQCLVSMDEEFGQGVIIGYINNDIPYSDGLTIGLKFPGIEIEIGRESGEARIKLTGDASLEVPNLSIKGNLKVEGDVEIQGDSKQTGDFKLTGNADVTGKVDATGVIKSLIDVQTSSVKLNTHFHGSAAPGSPTTSPIPGT